PQLYRLCDARIQALDGPRCARKPAAGNQDHDSLMESNPHILSRRALVRGAGIAASAGLLAGSPNEIRSARYTAKKGSVSLAMYRKRPAGSSLPVIFLVHGSSLSAQSSYDLEVPGSDDYSMMNVF